MSHVSDRAKGPGGAPFIQGRGAPSICGSAARARQATTNPQPRHDLSTPPLGA
jgi:hypothetical protein